jgi:signal transduction histidine kinase
MKPRLAGLHLQLLGLIFLPFSLFLLVVAIAGVQIHRDAMRQLVAERDERATRAAASAISQQLRHRDFAIRGLAARTPGAAPEQVLADSLFLLEDFDRGIAILDRSGEILASSIEPAVWADRPLAQLLENGVDDDAIFSAPFEESGQNLVLVLAQGKEGAAVGAFDVSSLIQDTLLNTVASAGDSISFVTDSSGKLLQYVGDKPELDPAEEHPGVVAALRGEHGSFYQPASDGEHVVAFSPVQPTRWSLIIEEPWQSVSSPVLDISLIAPLVLVPALMVTLVGLWFGATQVIRPLRELQDRAAGIEAAEDRNLEAPVGGIAEIQQLQGTLIQMADRLQTAHAALRSYVNALTHAQEDERQRMARELHDETIQDLIAIDQRIQLVSAELRDSNPEQAAMFDTLRGEVNRSVSELRRLVRALRPIYLEDLGLTTALEMLAKDLERDQKIRVEFHIEGDVRRMSAEVELAIYRIVQEALNNVARHSEAKSASIQFAFQNGTIDAEIRDDGIGFDLPPNRSRYAVDGLYGLMGMYERADLIGAALTVESEPGSGTSVRLLLPAT